MGARARYGVEQSWVTRPDGVAQVAWVVWDRVRHEPVTVSSGADFGDRKSARKFAAELNQRVKIQVTLKRLWWETRVQIWVYDCRRGFFGRGITLADDEAVIPWTTSPAAAVDEESERIYPGRPFRVRGMAWSGTVFVVEPEAQRRLFAAARKGTLRVDLQRLGRKP